LHDPSRRFASRTIDVQRRGSTLNDARQHIELLKKPAVKTSRA
jgi:hypothetical protein